MERESIINRIKIIVHLEDIKSALSALAKLGAKAYAEERNSRTFLFFYEKPREVQTILEFANKQSLVPMVRFFLVSNFKEIIAVLENLANTRNILDELSEFEEEIKRKLSQLKKVKLR